MTIKALLALFKRISSINFNNCQPILSSFQFGTRSLAFILFVLFSLTLVEIEAAQQSCRDSLINKNLAAEYLKQIQNQLVKMRKEYDYERQEGFRVTSEELSRAVVTVKNGRLSSPAFKKYVDTGAYKPNSEVAETAYNTYEFVITKTGKLVLSMYIEKHLKMRLYHSDLSLGEDVIAAGTIGVANGVVVEITNHSGHYAHGMSALKRGIKYLKLSGLVIPKEAIFDYAGEQR